MLAISKARIEQIEAYRRRMGWSFEWLSSHDNSFNRDLGVGFTSEEMEEGKGYYNYTEAHHLAREELPGMSVFAKDGVPHLLQLRARHRHVERRLSLFGYGPKGTR